VSLKIWLLQRHTTQERVHTPIRTWSRFSQKPDHFGSLGGSQNRHFCRQQRRHSTSFCHEPIRLLDCRHAPEMASGEHGSHKLERIRLIPGVSEIQLSLKHL